MHYTILYGLFLIPVFVLQKGQGNPSELLTLLLTLATRCVAQAYVTEPQGRPSAMLISLRPSKPEGTTD